MKSIYDYTLKDLESYFISLDENKFKAVQIFDWLYKKRVKKFDDMTNIKKELIYKLQNEFVIDNLKLIKINEDTDVTKF